MAPVLPAAAGPANPTTQQPAAAKIKRPPPPGIQTNGVSQPNPSPSPSLPTKRAPSLARQTPGARPPSGSGVRRDAPPGALASGQNAAGSIGSLSAGLAAGFEVIPKKEPIPYGEFFLGRRVATGR